MVLATGEQHGQAAYQHYNDFDGRHDGRSESQLVLSYVHECIQMEWTCSYKEKESIHGYQQDVAGQHVSFKV